MITFKPTLKRTKPPKSAITQKLMDRPLLAVRELNNRSLYHFLKCFWSEVSNEEFQDNWHIRQICDELQDLAEEVAAQRTETYKDDVDDLIINVPPGSSKTTIASIMFPAWCWTKWYWMEFIGLSYSSTLALEPAESCRDLVKSDKFQAMYPDLRVKVDKDQKSNFQVLKEYPGRPGYAPSVKQGGSRYSTSVGGTVTGMHGHIILIDDPINPEQAVSPKQLSNVNRWLTSTLPTRKIHKMCSPMVLIMQRLHQNDPTGHKLKNKSNVRHICMPGEIKNYEEQVKPPELKKYYSNDGLLDSVRMTWSVLDDLMADLGQYGYAGQVGQSPTPAQGGMFEVDKFVVVDTLPQDHEFKQIVRYWDKAGTEHKKDGSNDPAYTVGVKIAELVDGRYVILNVVRGRWGSGEREKIIKRTTEADGTVAHGVPVRVAVEQEPGSGGKESAENTIRNLRGFHVVADRPTGDKEYRADPYSVQVNWGNVLLYQGAWNKEFIEEHRYFPNSTYKDQVDAAAGGFNQLNKRRRARVMS